MADHPHTIDRWDDATGENLIEQIAAVGDYLVALETYRAAVKRWPKDKITLRNRARVIEQSLGGLAGQLPLKGGGIIISVREGKAKNKSWGFRFGNRWRAVPSIGTIRLVQKISGFLCRAKDRRRS